MLHAREIRLRWEREKTRVRCINRRQQEIETLLVDSHIGERERRVDDVRPAATGELANPVHRVVVIECGHIARSGTKRKRFTDQTESTARVGCEDRIVFVE